MKKNQNTKTSRKAKRRGLSPQLRVSGTIHVLVGVLMLTSLAICGFDSGQLFTRANKEYKFKIVASTTKESLNNSESLGVAWTVVGEPSYQTNNHPKSTYLAVFKSGVYIKQLHNSWLSTDDTNVGNKVLTPFINADSSEITAFQMEGGGGLLTLAFKNRTVFIVDVHKSSPEAPFITHKINFEASNTNEEGFITAIGHIPYSDLLVISQSVYNIVKIDRVSGKTMSNQRSPLDRIRFIVAPVKTTIPEKDPYNPAFKGINGFGTDLNTLVSLSRTMALTSADTEYTALMDWTTLSTITYFTVRKNHEKYDNPSEYAITSICFYGGVPVAQTYALMTKHTHKQVVLFDGIFNLYKGVVNLKTDYQNTQLTWLNGTTYILACQHNDGDSHCHPTLVDFSPRRGRGYTLNFTKENFTLPVNSHYQVMAYSVIKPKWTHLNMHYNLDYLFLSMYLENGSLVLKPPFFPWDFCEDDTLDGHQDPKFRVLIGMYRFCKNLPRATGARKNNFLCGEDASCTSFFHTPETSQILEQGLSANRFRRHCRPGWLNLVHYQTGSNFFYCSKGWLSGLPTTKLNKMVTPNPLDTFNRIDCARETRASVWDIFKSSTQSKKCLLFDYTDMIDDYTLNNDKIFFVVGFHKYKKSVLERIKGRDSLTKKNFYISNDRRFFYVSMYTSRIARSFYKACYFIEVDPEDAYKYKVRVKPGYQLIEIWKDSSGKAAQQIESYDTRGDFNRYFCHKDCPEGYFYDFDSVDCRLCPSGCYSCDSSGKCKEACPEGKFPVSKPRYTIHKSIYNHLIKNHTRCRETCQRGFFFSKDTGKCLECERNCLSCEPNPAFNPLIKNGEKRSRCLKCQNPEETGALFINYKTGQCSPKCFGKNLAKRSYNKYRGEEDVLFCFECSVENCSECEDFKSNECLKCQEGFQKMSKDTCREISPVKDSLNYWILGTVGVVGFVLLVIALLLIPNSFNEGLKMIDEQEELPVRIGADQQVTMTVSESQKGIFEPGKVERKTLLSIPGRKITVSEIINHSQGRIPEGRLVRTIRPGQYLFLSITSRYKLRVFQANFSLQENQEIDQPSQLIDLEGDIENDDGSFICSMYRITGIEVEQNQEDGNLFTLRIPVKNKEDEKTEQVLLFGVLIRQDFSLTITTREVEGAGAAHVARRN